MSAYDEIADLFEKLADHEERRAASLPSATPAPVPAPPKVAADHSERLARLQALVPLSPEVQTKIARDPSLLDSFEQLAVSAARPDPLGDAIGDDEGRNKSASSMTRAERAQQLWENWGRSISGG